MAHGARGVESHGANAIAAALAPWCSARLAARRGRAPWVLGLQGPQGCGKSTAAAALVDLATREGMRAMAVSIDDFYLTYEEQTALAARHPGNPTLLYRGYPGTHDVALGARVIDAIVASREGDPVLVPAYDKSAHAGRGDRAPEAQWRRVTGPFDLVVVEGWMLGFPPVDDASLDAHLTEPNGYLAAYAAWTSRLHALAHLTVASPATIVEWRVASERARRERGETALSDDDARDYIERFLPAYRAYVPALRAHPPCADFVALELGADHGVIGDARA
jgi:D-glycerate 3-kinase